MGRHNKVNVPSFDQIPKERASLATPAPMPLPAGRASSDYQIPLGGGSGWIVTAPLDHESFWRIHDLDTNHLDSVDPKDLLDMLADLSPEVSRAWWDFLRLCNPGYEYKAFEIGGETENLQAKAHIDDFFARLRDTYGSVDVVLNRFFSGAFLRGAFCSELVLDADARESIDLVAPEPFSIRFRRRTDALRGEVWQPGQWQGSDFVPLDIPTFRYLPVDPAPANPYGRPLAAPALFTSLFLLSLMHDIKRVVMQQGYRRLDISLNMEAAMDAYSFDNQGYNNLGEYVQAAIASVKSVYRTLQPDDAFFHTDIFELKDPVGAVDADSISAIDTIIHRLERMATRALKSNGLVMGTDASTNETDSNRRWEIHAAGVKSLQHLCESMMESQLTTSCRANGIQARIQFRFAELRASEMFRDAQTQAIIIQNARNEYEAGFTSQDEAAEKTVGHKADKPEPRKPIVQMDFIQDNNNGNEKIGGDERTVAIPVQPVILNGNGAVHDEPENYQN